MLLPQLNGNHISLRALKRSDIPALAKQANDRSISKFMPSIHFPYTAEDARLWVNASLRMARNDSAYQLGVELLSRKDIIGMMGIKNINRVDRNGELEYWLGRGYRGRSYASEAMRLMLRFAFHDLRLHRVYAIVVALNKPSIMLLERYGFVREAVWREATWIDNRWHDVYCYGLLETEQNKYE
jgi:[ribosomal protein S5]-alanine N-acetyltransferase